jgi:Putative beta-barrel porin-2, OmpL-like. bbp2
MITQLSWNTRARLKPFLIQKAFMSFAVGRRDCGFVLCSRAMFIVSICFSVLITSACVFAQSSAEPGQMATNSATGVPDTDRRDDADRRDDTDAQVLRELEQMRTRIQELEARLKQRSSAQKSATEAGASRPPMQDNFTAAPVPASVAASAQTQIESSNTEAKAPKAEPFAFADWTWLNGNARTKESPLDTKFFTPEIRADVDYIYDFNHPKDDTISGSSEVFRSNEIQMTQFGVGGDFHYDNVRARLMTQFGLYSQTTPRNDASPARGQWNLDNAYRYLSEAYGGYHFNALHGVNVDAGIFMSYIGLFSYYNFDNWAYQPSYVSSNTPWFFNGVRVQIFPTEKLKIEPWFINGWQSYGRFNGRPGVGGQILYRPNGSISIISNNYGVGADALGIPTRTRLHTDDSIEVKYYDRPEKWMDKSAFSVTVDAGCETGGGVNCTGNSKTGVKQSFLGFMFYNRLWFHKDLYGLTLGGGAINNPGRYLVLLPPINGATAASGTPYFTENPGDPYKAWDASATFDYMPSQYITFRWEYNHRHANVPYFSGPGGVTPPGGNTGPLGSTVILPSGATWFPDLRKTEDRINVSILVKF